MLALHVVGRNFAPGRDDIVYILYRDLARHQGRAVTPGWKKTDVCSLRMAQRIGNQITQRALEIIATVENPLGLADDLVQYLCMWPVSLLHHFLDFGIGGHKLLIDLGQLVIVTPDLFVPDLDIEDRNIFGVRTSFIDYGVIPDNRIVNRVVRMTADQYIDPIDALRELLIVTVTTVRDKHDQIRIFFFL